jgi:hypothetical protein
MFLRFALTMHQQMSRLAASFRAAGIYWGTPNLLGIEVRLAARNDKLEGNDNAAQDAVPQSALL